MAVCAICNHPCRGTCKRCGARLCYIHKPTSARSKCLACPNGTRSAVTASSYYVPSQTPGKPLADLSREESLAYLASLRSRLIAKQARERAYLDRRASRGTHTPTDEVYEQDQVLEAEIIALFDQMLSEL